MTSFALLFMMLSLHTSLLESELVTSDTEGPSWPWSYSSWIYNYLCDQCLSPLMLLVRISFGTRHTTLGTDHLTSRVGGAVFSKKIFWFPMLLNKIFWFWRWKNKSDLEFLSNNLMWKKLNNWKKFRAWRDKKRSSKSCCPKQNFWTKQTI